MLRGAVAEVEVPRLAFDRAGSCAEQLNETLARSPKRGRFYASRRRVEFAYGLEHLSDKAARCPVCQTYLAAWLADPQEFGGGLVLIGREHHAEGRPGRVEGAIGEWQR